MSPVSEATKASILFQARACLMNLSSIFASLAVIGHLRNSAST
jgi:hypothetical protein